MSHPVVHIEFSAKDREKAAEFYSKLCGWETTQMPEMNYATFQPSEGPGGGFNPVSEENPAGTVIVYLETDDIEADLKKVKELGGEVAVPKSDIPGMGWFAIFKDPTGNHVGLYTALGSSS